MLSSLWTTGDSSCGRYIFHLQNNHVDCEVWEREILNFILWLTIPRSDQLQFSLYILLVWNWRRYHKTMTDLIMLVLKNTLTEILINSPNKYGRNIWQTVASLPISKETTDVELGIKRVQDFIARKIEHSFQHHLSFPEKTTCTKWLRKLYADDVVPQWIWSTLTICRSLTWDQAFSKGEWSRRVWLQVT